jgi:hypothetical protein
MQKKVRNQAGLRAFQNLAEAVSEFPKANDFRSALVDDVHFHEGRFAMLSPRELLDGCGVEVGSMDGFCISQVPSDRLAFKNSDSGWSYIYTYRIQGKNRRAIRFKSEHGDGGVCDSCVGPYIYRRPSKKTKKA